MNELTREAFRVGSCETAEAAQDYGRSLTLKGVASSITCRCSSWRANSIESCPGRMGSVSPAKHAPVQLVLIEDGNTSRTSIPLCTQSADWMSRELGRESA